MVVPALLTGETAPMTGEIAPMTDEDLREAGLFDPDTDDPGRADLLRRCLGLGVTVDELRAAGDRVLPVAVDAIFRGPGEQLTLAEAAARAGLDDQLTEAIGRATGFAGARGELRVWNDDDIEALARFAAARDLLGADAMLQLVRAGAAAVARVGDTAISVFMTSAGAAAMAEDSSGLASLDANVRAAALLDEFGSWLTQSLRRYLRASYRDTSEEELATALTHGVDTPMLTVGFADLVGSTGHAERRSLVELDAALERFELAAADVVNARGGRLVKFIGDEVMFRADDPSTGAEAALDLVTAVRDDPQLPPIRAAIVHGMVLSREGDFHGPTVNLAARLLKLAPMNGVVAPLATAEQLGTDAPVDVEPLGAIEMAGMAEPVELALLRRR